MVTICITPVPDLPLYVIAELGDGFMVGPEGIVAPHARTVAVVWDSWLTYTNN